MSDGTLLFLAGLLGPVALWSLARFYWGTAGRPQLVAILVLLPLLIGVLLVAGALVVFADRFIEHSWTFVYWVTLGRGGAALAGLTAGLLIVGTLNIAAQGSGGWTWSAYHYATTGIVALGPAAAIAVLFVLAVPGARLQLGLSSVKVGGVEIALTTPPVPASPGTRGTGFTMPGPPSNSMFVGYFPQMLAMVAPIRECGNGNLTGVLSGNCFFDREARYLNLLNHVGMPAQSERGNDTLLGTRGAIWRQEEFLRKLGRVVHCAGFFHLSFPDVLTFRQLATRWLTYLVGVEIDLEDLALLQHGLRRAPLSAGPDIAKAQDRTASDLSSKLIGLTNESNRILKRLWDAMPQPVVEAAADHAAADLVDPELVPEACGTTVYRDGQIDARGQWTIEPLKLADLLAEDVPGRYEGKIVPPYLAMFIANAYGALLAKDAGLEVLNAWIKHYEAIQDSSKHDGEKPPSWLYDRALLQYGIVQELDEAVPTSVAERYYLDKIRKTIERDWAIDLARNGDEARHPEPRPDDREAFAKLFELYSDIVQRWLNAVVATQADDSGDQLTADQADMANKLLASADVYRDNVEEADFRDYRVMLARIAAGRFLARWATEGPRLGLLRQSDVELTRMRALKALLDALPPIRKLAAGHGDGTIRFLVPPADQVRRLVQDEVLDIEQRLAN